MIATYWSQLIQFYQQKLAELGWSDLLGTAIVPDTEYLCAYVHHGVHYLGKEYHGSDRTEYCEGVFISTT